MIEVQAPTIFEPIVLNTEHVKIRPLNAVSWKMLAEGLLYEDSFHSKVWGIKTPEDVKRLYENALLAVEAKKGNPVVFLNQNETEVLGMTQFMNVEPQHKMIEIGGTWINKNYQRSFVNTETKLALLTYCFEVLKLKRVEFRINSDNRISQKAVQRLGFHFDGFMPSRKINANGEVNDYVFYSVTDRSWSNVKTVINELILKSKAPFFNELSKARSLKKSGDHQTAFKLVLELIEKFPESGELQYEAASICDAYRTETEAISFYQKAFELGLTGSQKRDAYLGFASTYRSLGEYLKAKAIFEKGISEFPDYQPLKTFKALADFNLGKPEVAVEALLNQLLDTTSNVDIKSYNRALRYYSTRLNEVFD